MTLTPAYRRDYTSKAAVIADFLADKDFEVASLDSGGRYANRADIKDGTPVSIRYSRLTKQVCFTRGNEPKPKTRKAKASK